MHRVVQKEQLDACITARAPTAYLRNVNSASAALCSFCALYGISIHFSITLCCRQLLLRADSSVYFFYLTLPVEQLVFLKLPT